jgi:EAL domain-containing protein (putative c-di-GMP-specific phosphodiesterase class I)
VSNAELVAGKLVKEFRHPFKVNGHEVYTTISLGISIYPDDGSTLDQLMKYADMAMYQAKNNGRNNYCFFSHEMRRSSEEQMMISTHLRHAIAREELSLYYQPKIDIDRSRIIGAEALLRWHSKDLGSISPEVFIPLAEQSGLINDLGNWVLQTACQEAMEWEKRYGEKLHVSVNISPQQFRTGILFEAVENALSLSGLPPERLELEITESLLLQDSDEPLALLRALHENRIRLALDDFGTGYSSLSYLRRFPLQVLKIDRSFISGLTVDQSSCALVDAIIAMAHSLELELVAEGVENENELTFLRQRGVEVIQGYFFSPPLPVDKFRALLSEKERTP